MTDLDAADAAEPNRPSPGDVTLLEQLPYLRLNLAQAPDPCSALCSRPPARLTIDLYEHSDDATISVTLPADDLPAFVDAAHNLPAETAHQPLTRGDRPVTCL